MPCPMHLAEVIAKAANPYVAELLAANEAMGKTTIGEKFVMQLETLASQLDAGGALFVRCTKSNLEKLPVSSVHFPPMATGSEVLQ